MWANSYEAFLSTLNFPIIISNISSVAGNVTALLTERLGVKCDGLIGNGIAATFHQVSFDYPTKRSLLLEQSDLLIVTVALISSPIRKAASCPEIFVNSISSCTMPLHPECTELERVFPELS